MRNSVDNSGIVNTRTYRYTPIGNGKLRVEMSDGMYSNCKIELMELSPYLILTTAVDANSGRNESKVSSVGKPLLVESVTILDNVRRVRTIQDFSAAGNMTDVFVINETRILDPAASELAPYEMVRTKPENI